MSAHHICPSCGKTRTRKLLINTYFSNQWYWRCPDHPCKAGVGSTRVYSPTKRTSFKSNHPKRLASLDVLIEADAMKRRLEAAQVCAWNRYAPELVAALPAESEGPKNLSLEINSGS